MAMVLGDQERLGGDAYLPPWTHHEHQARYAFACRYVNGATVVDCASGVGAGARRFAAAGASSVIALDASPGAIVEARSVTRPASLRLAVADASELPLDGRCADVYVSFETIEHLADDGGYLREVVRVLKEDGVFVCSTPDRRIKNPGKSLADRPLNPFHLREYDEGEFLAMLRPLFDSIEQFGQNPTPGALVATLGQLGRRLGGPLAALFFKASKLHWYLLDRPERHAVEPYRAARNYEYMVVVCRGPRGSA
jgi:SAM-dependent methyltransferase